MLDLFPVICVFVLMNHSLYVIANQQFRAESSHKLSDNLKRMLTTSNQPGGAKTASQSAICSAGCIRTRHYPL